MGSHLGAGGTEEGSSLPVCIPASNGLRGHARRVGIGKVSVCRLVVCDGEERSLGRRGAPEEKTSASGAKSPDLGGGTDLWGAAGAKRSKVDGTAQSVRAVDGRGRAMHDLDGLEEHRGEEGQVEVPPLWIGQGLPIEQERRL